MARDRRGRAIPPTLEKQQDEFKTYADVRAMTSYSMQILLHCLAGLRSLRTKYIVSGFSILSFGILVDGSKRAGLSWDSLISCEFLGYYKPDPNSYKKAAELLGLKPSEVMMVAAHKSDLGAAMSAGFLAAYTPRPLEYGALDDRDLSVARKYSSGPKTLNFLDLQRSARYTLLRILLAPMRMNTTFESYPRYESASLHTVEIPFRAGRADVPLLSSVD